MDSSVGESRNVVVVQLFFDCNDPTAGMDAEVGLLRRIVDAVRKHVAAIWIDDDDVSW